ncbi:MAG: DNA translocase FtsK [Candidatus Omnitrophica bacterium]|nr:DNA translocase FtsK [Candidatus Omnitrophota bacterium]
MKQERINEIWAIFFFAMTVIAFVSLFTFNPSDTSFYTSNPNRPVNNFAGVVGAHFSALLIFSLGKASFVIPFLTLIWAAGRFIGRIPQKFYVKVLGAAVFIIASSSMLSLMNRYDSVIRFSSGGIIGLGFSSFLIKYFSVVGSYIILSTLLVLSLLLATEFLLFPFLFIAYTRLKSLTTSTKKSPLPKEAREPSYALKKPVKPKRIIIQHEPAIKTAMSSLKALAQNAVKKKDAPIKPVKTVAPAVNKKRVESKKEVISKARDEAAKAPVKRAAASDYVLPSLDLLDSPPPVSERALKEDLETSARILEDTLSDFDLEVKVVKIEQGPVITRYELEPAPGIKISRIANLSDNIALAMKAQSVRIEAPIPGKGTIGVEVPNSKSALVYLKEILVSKAFKDSESKLTIALGKDISGHSVFADLDDMPHLLIAGTTGSGKTVCVNSLIASLLFRASPEELKFLMVDPKMVELSTYNNIPHLLCPVVTEAKKVSAALKWVVGEMENRYKLFAETTARNITIYNKKAEQEKKDILPYIVVIIDELADLMVVAQQEIESAITRLAQLSRAVGIHIVLATQRPSVDVITGVIKANFPARISFKVASKVDSRTVLDMNGADKLLGKGDMLFIEPGTAKPIRAQGSLVSDAEIDRIVGFIKKQRKPEYSEGILNDQKKTSFKSFEKDEVYEEAVKLVLQTSQASVSMLQRRLGVGYTRAARLIDMMEDEGIVGPYAGSKPRDILIENMDERGPKEADNAEGTETQESEL